jgi:two-component SAPR family response regulator
MGQAIEIAHVVLAVDPSAMEAERSLVWLYNATGARSAAAEQYAHYAAMHREQLGVDAPSMEDVVGGSLGASWKGS